ncbi:MAG: hypothetical protein LBC88_04635 [Spirochaetaceae bacterium]|nr:hypothetical protein [Spirochaetaceae bacterium]
MKKGVWLLFVILASAPLAAQDRLAVPLGSAVYRILESAQLRGLVPPLPTARPYSRKTVLAAIDAILEAGAASPGSLSAAERRVLEEIAARYAERPEEGFSWTRGAWHFGDGRPDRPRVSANVGLRLAEEVSGSVRFERGDAAWGNDTWITPYIEGALGEHLSWAFVISGRIMRMPREQTGTYHTFYPGFNADPSNAPYNTDREITVYGQPHTHFPYTYRKLWHGFVWDTGLIDNSGQLGWPNGVSIGYDMLPEVAGGFFEDHLLLRAGRLDRDWGAGPEGSSLILNRAALPFLGVELTAKPLSWLYFSSVTGILEYSLDDGGSISPFDSQNAFSLAMVEINIGNFLHFETGSSAIWPKRYELGYLFPLISNFLNQDAIGDFDNMALFFNAAGQYPGKGKLWFSFYLDEINPQRGIFEMDKAMFAYQGGVLVNLPFLPFALVSLSYTKIEPYCYTHTRVYTPWYGQDLMQEAYTNGGYGLGYYLPPNSDEIKLRFDMTVNSDSRAHFQYQMIRHGADHGPDAVDGSNYRSELSSRGRSDRPELKKFFLRDGAYEWLHVIRLGGEYTFRRNRAFPFTLYGEAGVVFSYYTSIEAGKANTGAAYDWSVINTPDYPRTTSFIATIGIRLFPDF